MVWETEYLFFRIQVLFFSEGSNWLRFNWTTPEKSKQGRLIWNFEGYPRNSMLNFWGLIKNEVEFPKRWPRKNVELPGIFVFGLGISKGSNTILWNNFLTLWPLFMDGVQLPQGYSHFEEAVYFLPFSSQKFLLLILSTSEGGKAESTLELPSRFEHGTRGLWIQRLNR